MWYTTLTEGFPLQARGQEQNHVFCSSNCQPGQWRGSASPRQDLLKASGTWLLPLICPLSPRLGWFDPYSESFCRCPSEQNKAWASTVSSLRLRDTRYIEITVSILMRKRRELRRWSHLSKLRILGIWIPFLHSSEVFLCLLLIEVQLLCLLCLGELFLIWIFCWNQSSSSVEFCINCTLTWPLSSTRQLF